MYEIVFLHKECDSQRTISEKPGICQHGKMWKAVKASFFCPDNDSKHFIKQT